MTPAESAERALLRRLMEARRAFHNGPSTPEKFAEWDAALAAADALLAEPEKPPRSRAEAEAMVEAAHLKRNTIIRGGDFPAKTFVGDWVAIPREDFDALKSARAALDRLKEGG